MLARGWHNGTETYREPVVIGTQGIRVWYNAPVVPRSSRERPGSGSSKSEVTMTWVQRGLGRGRLLFVVLVAALAAAQARAVDNAAAARLRKDINFLASDPCEGRGVATPGINLA